MDKINTSLAKLSNEGYWANVRNKSLIGVVCVNNFIFLGLSYGLATQRLNVLEPLKIFSFRVGIGTTMIGSFSVTVAYMLYVLRNSRLPAGPLLQYLRERLSTTKEVSVKEKEAIARYEAHVAELEIRENELQLLHWFPSIMEITIDCGDKGELNLQELMTVLASRKIGLSALRLKNVRINNEITLQAIQEMNIPPRLRVRVLDIEYPGPNEDTRIKAWEQKLDVEKVNKVTAHSL